MDRIIHFMLSQLPRSLSNHLFLLHQYTIQTYFRSIAVHYCWRNIHFCQVRLPCGTDTIDVCITKCLPGLPPGTRQSLNTSQDRCQPNILYGLAVGPCMQSLEAPTLVKEGSKSICVDLSWRGHLSLNEPTSIKEGIQICRAPKCQLRSEREACPFTLTSIGEDI